MDDRLNVKTQIWADGYSFMEVTETLLMAMGIRSEDGRDAEPAQQTAAAADRLAGHGSEMDR